MSTSKTPFTPRRRRRTLMKPSNKSTSSDYSHLYSKTFDHSSPQTNTIINNHTTNSFPTHNLYYEPTSVLDPHLPPPSYDWDPLSWLLTDTSSSFDHLTDFVNTTDYQHSDDDNNIPVAFDRAHLDLLLRAASSIESNDLATAHLILSRLNYAFPSLPPSTPAIHRAAFHFRDALLSLLPIPNPPIPSPPPSPLDTVRRITAQKSFSDLSPIPQFTSFTANQTLLESLVGDNPPPSSIHVIDFELGLGGQWSSFAHEIHARTRSSPPMIRVTAVVPEETVETALAAENLRDFARAVGARLSIDFVRVGALGALALAGVRLSSSASEPVGVVLTPAIFGILGGSPESSAALLRFVRRVSPRIVVFVDTECSGGGTAFRRSFAGGMEYYSAILESVDAAAAAKGAGDETARRVERSVVRPRIFAAVSGWVPREIEWREMFAANGMSPAAFSEFTESQAEWLLRRAPAEGFHVARWEGCLTLSWKGRELASTSAWRC